MESSNRQHSTEMALNRSPSERDSQGLQQRIRADIQTQLLGSNNQDLIATLVRSNDVEERDRYRHQWRREDRQRVTSDRLELLVAVIIGVIIGCINNWVDFGGGVTGFITGILIWFFTGLLRNRWSP